MGKSIILDVSLTDGKVIRNYTSIHLRKEWGKYFITYEIQYDKEISKQDYYRLCKALKGCKIG